MTEELKIIIKAVTDNAKKNLKNIKEEIQKIDKESQEARKSTGEALAGITKGAAVAVGAVVGLTTAMVALGKSTEEFRKAQAKVNTTFQALGSNSSQAAKTYEDLYRFLGDDANAAETAQSLALITTNEKELAEWTTILQGVYSSMGDKLPINSLAEAANETIKVGKVTSSFADALNWVGVSEDAFNEKLAQTATLQEREALVRNTLNGLYRDSAALYEANNSATLKNNESQYRLNVAMAEAAKYTVPLMTALNNLGATLFNSFGGALQTVCAYLIVFIEWIAAAASWVGAFFGMFTGTEAVAEVGGAIKEATSNSKGLSNGVTGLGSALDGAAESAKELKKQTMGFDELNVVSSQSTSSSGGGGSAGGGTGGGLGGIGGIDMSGVSASLDDTMSGFKDKMEEAKEKIEAILVLVGLVGAGFLTWKILGVEDWGKVLGVLKNIGGYALIAAGAILLIKGYTDAWVNGIDWANLGEIIAGVGLIVGGLALAFGSVAAAIGLVVGAVALIIIGVKDLIENGYSMEAVIAVTIGVIGVLIGLIWAFNSALLANPITWVVVGIVALIAAIVLLWNECDWFRNAIKAVWDWIVNAFDATVKWFDKALKDVGQFFVKLWQGIKNTFSSIGSWFSTKFKEAVSGIKKAFSAVGSFFSSVWSNIKNIFSNVGSTIASAISNSVKFAINGVLSTAVKIINGFISAINLAIDIINAIPAVNIKKLDKLQVPKLATGGILTRESLFIGGEGGKKEAVLPLEQNTEWMDILADRIANRNTAPSKVVLNVDGKELGWAAIHNMNSITKQTGALQLVLV
jgi:phage-related protein